METCFTNLVEAGDKVVIARNGVFGQRMAEMATRLGAEVVTIDDQWGQPVDPQKLEAALESNPDTKVVGFVHRDVYGRIVRCPIARRDCAAMGA